MRRVVPAYSQQKKMKLGITGFKNIFSEKLLVNYINLLLKVQ